MPGDVLYPVADDPIRFSGRPTRRWADVAIRLAGELAGPAPPGAARPPAALLLAWAVGLVLLGTLVYLAPTASAGFLGVAAIGVPVVWLWWLRPELGLLAMSFFTAGLVPRTAV